MKAEYIVFTRIGDNWEQESIVLILSEAKKFKDDLLKRKPKSHCVIMKIVNDV